MPANPIAMSCKDTKYPALPSLSPYPCIMAVTMNGMISKLYSPSRAATMTASIAARVDCAAAPG